jgi:predicted small secreted protein
MSRRSQGPTQGQELVSVTLPVGVHPSSIGISNCLGDEIMNRLISLLIAAIVLAGCNTIQGAGTDIERGGEKIQDAAGKAKN